jgi:tRNA U34 2-thiouridine synthase MnmA/TrmU
VAGFVNTALNIPVSSQAENFMTTFAVERNECFVKVKHGLLLSKRWFWDIKSIDVSEEHKLSSKVARSRQQATGVKNERKKETGK